MDLFTQPFDTPDVRVANLFLKKLEFFLCLYDASTSAKLVYKYQLENELICNDHNTTF